MTRCCGACALAARKRAGEAEDSPHEHHLRLQVGAQGGREVHQGAVIPCATFWLPAVHAVFVWHCPQDFLLIPTEKLEREFLVNAAKVRRSLPVVSANDAMSHVKGCAGPVRADVHVIQDHWHRFRVLLQPGSGCCDRDSL